MEKTARRGRGLLLALSLCLNLLLILAGLWVCVGRPHYPLAPGAVARGLPPQERERILDIAADHRDALDVRQAATARARQEVLALLAAPDFDARAFAASLARLGAAEDALGTERDAVLAEVTATLTPRERALLAERVRVHARSWWPQRGIQK